MNSAASRSASEQMPEDFKRLLGQAIELKNQERYAEAAQLLEQLSEAHPGSASVRALLADALWEQNDLAGAVASFRQAVKLAPTSEMASLGLFHTLLETGDKQGAIAEMNRFLTMSDSEEYRALAQTLGHNSAAGYGSLTSKDPAVTSSSKPRPDKFWHCFVQLIGGKKYAVANDLSFSELQRQVIDPWHRGVAFPVSGLVVSAREQVEKIKITHTDRPLDSFVTEKDARDRASGVRDWATDRHLLPIWRGTDHTHELLFETLKSTAPEPEIALILQLCKRLPAAARILSTRRKGKRAFKVGDEYDAQDLFHAILRAYLKYTVHEETLGKVGGAHSGRADVAIEELGAVVELKYVHGPDDQKRIVDEFSNDLLLYTKWPHLKHFIYLVYNAQDLRDPEALEKLAGQQTVNGVPFTAYVVLA